ICVAPSCSAARSSASWIAESSGTGCSRCVSSSSSPRPSSSAMAARAVRANSSARAKPSAVGERTSTENSATPGMTLKPPGSTMHMPTFAVMSSRPRSSSLKETTQSGRRGSTLSSWRIRTASSAARTPSAPSKRPPQGTVSRCEPTSTAASSPASQRPNTLPAGSTSVSRPSAPKRFTSHSFACASSGVQAKRETPPSSAPMRAAASRSAASEDTASSQPAVNLDRAGDGKCDRERDQKALQRLLLEDSAAEVAEQSRVGRPAEPCCDVEREELAPAHLEEAGRERNGGASAWDKPAHDDEVGASLLDLGLGPVDARLPFPREETLHDPRPCRAADPVGRVVTEHGAGGGGEDHGDDEEIASPRKHARKDHGCLARDEREENVEGGDPEEVRVRPDGVRDVLLEGIEHLLSVCVRREGRSGAQCLPQRRTGSARPTRRPRPTRRGLARGPRPAGRRIRTHSRLCTHPEYGRAPKTRCARACKRRCRRLASCGSTSESRADRPRA